MIELNTGTNEASDWTVAEAVREILANAIDETLESGCSPIEIEKVSEDVWLIRDFGRGLKISHLVRGEGVSAKSSVSSIGTFGAGLKQSFAVLQRKDIAVQVESAHLYIKNLSMEWQSDKEAQTLHIDNQKPVNKDFIGTLFTLKGLKDTELQEAKSFFLDYEPLEQLSSNSNNRGVTLEILEPSETSSIYINGGKQSTVKNMLFSYNFTNVTEELRRAGGEHRNGESANKYQSLIVSAIKHSRGTSAMERLVTELRKDSPDSCQELKWAEVRKVVADEMSKSEKVLYVTVEDRKAIEYGKHPLLKKIIESESWSFHVVSQEEMDKEKQRVRSKEEAPFYTIETLYKRRNDQLGYIEIPRSDLTSREINQLGKLVENVKGLLIESGKRHNIPVVISEIIGSKAHVDTRGLWSPSENKIVLVRYLLDESKEREAYHVLFHEFAHAQHNYHDNTREFESELGELLGDAAMRLWGHSPKPSILKLIRAKRI